MSIQILQAETFEDHYHFEVWMDTTKSLADGSPDPAYIRVVDYSKNFPEGVADEDSYMLWIQERIKLLVKEELNNKKTVKIDKVNQMKGKIL